MRGVPQQRAPEFGTRQHLTDEEFAARARSAKARDKRRTAAPSAPSATRKARAPSATRRWSSIRRTAAPAVLAEARRAAQSTPGSFGVGPWNKMADFTLYDRCITRGVVGSFGPAVYGNGARIVQTPDAVVISYEMVHDTRIIPLDGRPPLAAGIQQYMGDSRGRWEGDTLVIESANFTDKTADRRRAPQRAAAS